MTCASFCSLLALEILESSFHWIIESCKYSKRLALILYYASCISLSRLEVSWKALQDIESCDNAWNLHKDFETHVDDTLPGQHYCLHDANRGGDFHPDRIWILRRCLHLTARSRWRTSHYKAHCARWSHSLRLRRHHSQTIRVQQQQTRQSLRRSLKTESDNKTNCVRGICVLPFHSSHAAH